MNKRRDEKTRIVLFMQIFVIKSSLESAGFAQVCKTIDTLSPHCLNTLLPIVFQYQANPVLLTWNRLELQFMSYLIILKFDNQSINVFYFLKKIVTFSFLISFPNSSQFYLIYLFGWTLYYRKEERKISMLEYVCMYVTLSLSLALTINRFDTEFSFWRVLVDFLNITGNAGILWSGLIRKPFPCKLFLLQTKPWNSFQR